ncbi:hypothetical protein [Nostoc sp. UHCC 0251]|uniref:hypothetical protein n=1 Tax=Nostoc sp. UHCC 0251 TaxID=3110240 RepID=UPI002B209416|nr:hypothetical protein [Nostoc sp. UHCC 0251]MEA5623668.1 hypothetical protein [Nostoc sp. UHCC 0251]
MDFTTLSRKYIAYAVNYICEDVTNLADLRHTNSGSRVVGDDWANLLTAVSLPEFAFARIVGRYGLLQ